MPTFSSLQQTIYHDRYALKGGSISTGNMVLIIDKKSEHYNKTAIIQAEIADTQPIYMLRLSHDLDGPLLAVSKEQIITLLETDYQSQTALRVAQAIAKVEETPELKKLWSAEFHKRLANMNMVPGGRIISGAGVGDNTTHFNCYVIPNPKDSRLGIMHTLGEMWEIMARGGGVGINLSSLRPRGSRIRGTNGVSSGAVSLGELFSILTGKVSQSGSRNGALMVQLADWHPDIFEFIDCKDPEKPSADAMKNANLSVQVSDELVMAARNNEDWDLVYPDIDDPKYLDKWNGDLEDWIAQGGEVVTYKTIKARELWHAIADHAWKSGDPGIVFMGRMNKEAASSYYTKYVCTNPCGEQSLPPYGVCNLASMVLPKYVSKGVFDYNALARDVAVAVRFLDNVIDDNHYFIPENEKLETSERRIGIGVQGLAHTFYMMGVRYASPEANEITREIYRTLRDSAFRASIELSKEKGPFPYFVADKYLATPFISRLPEDIREDIRRYGIRNVTLLTQQPTGSTSLLSGYSSGLEPVFRRSYSRKDNTGVHTVYDPVVQEWVDAHPGLELPDFFVQADELTPREHVTVQAIAQEYIDQSISKTVNAPNHHTVQECREVFDLAYDLGCKGITYFRDGSKTGVLSELPKKEESTQKVQEQADLSVSLDFLGFSSMDDEVEALLGEGGCLDCKLEN